MKIELFINGFKFLEPSNNFSDAILYRITQTAKNKKYQKLHRTKANEIKRLTEICLEDELVSIIHKHLTLDFDFALKLLPYDIVNCKCLKPTTETGEVIKELMLDYYQLILNYRDWGETDYLKLYFEVVGSGDAFDYIINTLNLKD